MVQKFLPSRVGFVEAVLLPLTRLRRGCRENSITSGKIFFVALPLRVTF